MNPKTMPPLLLAVEEHLLGQGCVPLQDLVEQLRVICRFVKSAEHLILIRGVKPHSFLQIFPPPTTGCLRRYTDIRLLIHSLVNPHQCPLQVRTHQFGASHHQAGDIVTSASPFFISFVDYVYVSAFNSTSIIITAYINFSGFGSVSKRV